MGLLVSLLFILVVAIAMVKDVLRLCVLCLHFRFPLSGRGE
jgi:hypothetical protein